MRLLLDTHVALWFVLGNERLAPHARSLISDPEHAVYVSVISLLEIATKNNVRKSGPQAIGLSMTQADALFQEDGFTPLPLDPSQIVRLETMALHHRDPFDRLLIAQAQAEQMRLVTVERQLAEYGEAVMLV